MHTQVKIVARTKDTNRARHRICTKSVGQGSNAHTKIDSKKKIFEARNEKFLRTTTWPTFRRTWPNMTYSYLDTSAFFLLGHKNRNLDCVQVIKSCVRKPFDHCVASSRMICILRMFGQYLCVTVLRHIDVIEKILQPLPRIDENTLPLNFTQNEFN